MYLNLLFKAVKADSDHARVAAFVKRVVQVLGVHRPEFICGGLYLLGEVSACTLILPFASLKMTIIAIRKCI